MNKTIKNNLGNTPHRLKAIKLAAAALTVAFLLSGCAGATVSDYGDLSIAYPVGEGLPRFMFGFMEDSIAVVSEERPEELYQVLRFEPLADGCSARDTFALVDIDFSGVADITFSRLTDANGERCDIYLWESESGFYVYSKELSALYDLQMDVSRRTVSGKRVTDGGISEATFARGESGFAETAQ